MYFLLVEDMRTTRNLIKSYILDLPLGCPIDFLEAENGEDALEILANHHVDFVFMDWNLSTIMTGLDVLKKIRKIDKFKDLPIILVTSESDKENVILALKFGATNYIVKPIDKNSFNEKTIKAITNMRNKIKNDGITPPDDTESTTTP